MFTAAHLQELDVPESVLDDARKLGISLKDLLQMLIKYGVEMVKEILADMFKVLPSAK